MTAVPPCVCSAGHKLHGVAIDLRATEELGGCILLLACVLVLLASVAGIIEVPASAKQPVWLDATASQPVMLASAQ